MNGILAGKTLVVSGVASGIGAETATLLMQRGATVLGVDLNKPSVAVSEFFSADLGDAAAIDLLVKRLAGRIDGLANVAGLPGNRGVDITMRVNVLGLRHFTESLVSRMPAGSAVVNLASVAGNGWAERYAQHKALAQTADFARGLSWLAEHSPAADTVYPYSKEAVIVWTMLRSGELFRKHGIRMNCVSPGPVDTPILEDFRNTLGRAKVAQAIEIMGRPGAPADIAPVIAFLLSDDSHWMVGENLRVDAGLSATRFVGT